MPRSMPTESARALEEVVRSTGHASLTLQNRSYMSTVSGGRDGEGARLAWTRATACVRLGPLLAPRGLPAPPHTPLSDAVHSHSRLRVEDVHGRSFHAALLLGDIRITAARSQEASSTEADGPLFVE